MFSQNPVSFQLTEKDGLPDIEFYTILEDNKGFVWLAADKGLFRYNGKDFLNFTNVDKKGLSLFGIFEDDQNRIWCNNISSQFFYVQNNKLVTFIDLSFLIKTGELVDFIVKNNKLLIFTFTKFYSVDVLSKEVKLINENPNGFGKPFLFQDLIYHCNANKVQTIDGDLKIKDCLLFDLSSKNKDNSLIEEGKPVFFKTKNNLFTVKKRNKLNVFFKLNLQNRLLEEVAGLEILSNKQVVSFIENKNEIWATTNAGVYVFEFKENVFYLKKNLLADEFVTKAIQDKDQNYWFTTLTNGVFVIPNIHVEEFKIKEASKNISCFEKVDENTIIFGTNKGDVSIYNLRTNKETIVDLDRPSRVSAIKYIPESNTTYISKDDGGFLLNMNNLKATSESNMTSVKSFLLLNNSRLLFVNPFNTLIRNLKNGKDSLLVAQRRGYSSFFSKQTNNTYIAYVDNLVVFDTNFSLKTIQYKNKSILGISIAETDNETIWVGTFQDGVYGIQNKKVVFKIDESNGLISNEIEVVKADGHLLWIATSKGIQLYNTKSNTFQLLNERDGILSYKISGIEIFDNKVVFSSNKGLFSIDKSKVFKSQKEPEIYFSDFRINETSKPLQTIYSLNHNQNAIQISFNVNGFQFNQKGVYQYRMKGLSPEWITLNIGENFVKFNSLPPGDYVFQVKAAFSKNFKEITIVIKSPFWQKWWFYLLISVLILGIGFIFFKIKIRKSEREKQIALEKSETEKELVFFQLENLRSQMNPHFIFNALNSIQEYILTNDKENASDYLVKFSRLIRMYLEQSRENEVSLNDEVKALQFYLELEKNRFDEQLDFAIEIHSSINPSVFFIPSLFLQPYVENAIKHGLMHKKGLKSVSIHFDYLKETLICTITDNGIGRNESENIQKSRNHMHKSFATSANQKRVDLLNRTRQNKITVQIIDLLDNNSHSIGTQVLIKIPLDKNESTNY